MNANKHKLSLSGEQGVAVYQQIKNAIEQKIRQGAWSTGEMIPSENQLTSITDTSRMTVNRALRELTSEGLLRRVHGLGTFVAEPARHAQLIELKSIAEEIKQAGHQYSAQVLAVKAVSVAGEIAQRMQLEEGTMVHFAEVVHCQNSTPIQLEQRWVNPSLVDGFLDNDFTQITPTDYLISQIHPEDLEHVVQAILPSDLVAQHLDIPTLEPCLKLRRRSFKDQQIVTSVDLIYPSSRYDLGARFRPN